MERFPALGLMMGTAECKSRPEEAIPPIALDKEEVFYFYGLHEEVYFQSKEWLKNPEKKLVFIEDDLGIIASFLENPAAEKILSNSQVYIELLGDIEPLVQRFPVKRVEVAGLASKKKLRRLRIEILRKTALAHGLHMDRLHGYQPFHNFVQNLAHLPNSFYANGLKGAFTNVPAIVCGAGPSLGPTIKTLRKMENKALIIAGGSTLAALSSRGILPHFGMALDPNLEELRRMKNSFAFEVPILYSTRVHPDIFRTCNGPFGYMRSGIGGLVELWIEEELGLLDPLLGDFLSPETISVTGICIAYAQFLGCNPILLNGIDMAYTGGSRYASGVTDEKKIAFDAIDREKSAADRILRKKDRNGKTVYSAVRWIMESASISHFAKKHPEVEFINTTIGGIGFKGIDYVPIEEAVKDFKEQNLREQVFQKIDANPMPAFTREKISEQMEELKKSLARLIDSLEILAGERKGIAALAEMEIQEEIATLFLFYDIRQILKPGELFWKNWLDLARKYERMLL
ncbi:MAG: DUF115 domain-containing protein [Parachlamydiales bacterium]|nr:DUF115 domain-containing protein [Parachlamydiales bacterium]